MPTLDCSVRNCSYNADNKCCLEAIAVEGRDATTTDATACGCGTPTQNANINCAVCGCTYNKANTCQAQKVDIAGISAKNIDQTECGTFRMK